MHGFSQQQKRKNEMAKTKTSENNVAVNRISSVLDAPESMDARIVVFHIVGRTPLLQNNPVEFIGKTGEDELGTKKVYIDEEEAAKRVYKTADGAFYHPSESFKKAMYFAVKGRKFGKKSAPGLITSSVFPAETESLLIDSKGKPLVKYTIDRRSVVNPSNKARVLRCRPSWSPWEMKVAIELDVAILSEIQALQALQLAGRIIGIGDYRPQKGGGFGRFTAEIE